MSVNYYKSNLTSAEIDAALQAIDGLIGLQNNGKILYVNNGKLAAKSAAEFEGAVLEPLSVTMNGDYYPPSGTDGFDEVHVAVPSATLTTKSITANGTYNASSDNADGYSSVTVNVSGGGSAVVQSLSVTQNGTYTPPSGIDGYAPVTVNVQGGGGAGPIYSGTSVPTASIGVDEDLYIQYEIKSDAFDHTYGLVAEYRKENGVWVPYTAPESLTKGVHIWTKDMSGSYAAMYVQNGYWDYGNNTFVTTGEAESVIYSTVQSWDTAKDCNGVALLAYRQKWQIKASTTVTDGTNTYQADQIVAEWSYSQQKDIYVYKPQS